MIYLYEIIFLGMYNEKDSDDENYQEHQLSQKEFDSFRRNISTYCRDGSYQELKKILELIDSMNINKKEINKIANSLKNHETCYHICIKNDNFECFKLLWEKTGKIRKFRKFNSILHYSVTNNKIDFVKYIVENKIVDIDNYGFANVTPLHVACYYKRIEIIKYLMEKGANHTIKSKQKLNALDYCGVGETLTFFKKCILSKINKMLYNKTNFNKDMINLIDTYVL